MMTKKIGNMIYIQEESPSVCEECGKVAEVRPYGKDGANICFDCGMKDEDRTMNNFSVKLLGEEGEIQ